MIRQICPSCFHPIELPDGAAGTTAVCPLCAKPFPVPPGYVPAVDADRPAPPPGLIEASKGVGETGSGGVETASTPTPPLPDSPTSPPSGYGHSCSAALAPGWVHWVPAVALTLVLLLTFFGWVGAFPGGYRVFTQSPWQALFGWFSDHTLSEAAAAEKVELSRLVTSDILFLLPYLLLLIATLKLVWAERLGWVPNPERLPPALRWSAGVWPIRRTLVAGFAAAGLVLIAVQVTRGFGLESAAEERVVQLVAKAQEGKAAAGQPMPPPAPFLLGEIEGRYSLSGTTARGAALLLHAVAVLALFAQLWLDNRGSKPHPKAVLYW